MYTQQELESIDRNYFAVIVADEYDVTLMSLNTRHMWQLHNVELPDGEVTVLFHKHHVSDQYHLQGKRRTMRRAIGILRIMTNTSSTAESLLERAE